MDPRGSLRLSDLRTFSLRPTLQSGGGLAFENGLGVAAPPGILCKRKDRAPGLAARLEAGKAADPPGRCPQRAVFETTSKAWPPSCDAWPGPRLRSPLGPGAPFDGASPCAGPLRVEVGAAGAGGPASGEGRPVHRIFRKLLKSAPGCFFRGTVE